MDKALMLVTMLFVGIPLIGSSLLISWLMDPDKNKKTDETATEND